MNFISPFIKFQLNLFRNITQRVDAGRTSKHPFQKPDIIVENIVYHRKAMRRLNAFKKRFDEYLRLRERINEFPPAPYCPE